MTANEARKLTESSICSVLEEIYKEIEHAAKSGKNILVYHFKHDVYDNGEIILNKLINDGYITHRNRGSDMRGESWDYLTIQW